MPKSRIDETLKQIAGGKPGERSKTSSKNNPTPTLGDPGCPNCHGIGYLRQDVPAGHPDFGKLVICECRKGQVSRQVRERLFSLSHLDELKALTFDTFQLHGRKGLSKEQANSLERAFNQAKQYAGLLKGWLLLQGGYGCGKTHLAAAVANYAVDMGVPTLFLTVPDLLDSLRFAYDSEDTSFEERFDEIRNAPFLVLDDFGTQNATGWAQEKLFQIINYRYTNQLPLLVTTNLPLDDIDARIRSRFSDPELVSLVRIAAPDYRRPMDDSLHPELSSLELHRRRTFASFDDRKYENLAPDEVRSLEKAVKAATDFAARPVGWLVLTGPYGCGKTHLAAAIANVLTDKGNPPLFIMVPDLLDHLRATFSPSSPVRYDRRFDEIRTSPVLILDDLGAQSTSPWAREKLHQLFNHRYNAELPTVMTVADEMFDTIDERLRVRLQDDKLCRVLYINVPAYHGGKRKTKSK
jgi:DNA replication protein DnaC